MTIITGLKVDAGTGAGSRGGKVIGRTKTGKAIYMNASHSAHASFDHKEHKQAATVHSEKAETLRRYSGSPKERAGRKEQAAKHEESATQHKELGRKAYNAKVIPSAQR